MTTESSVLVIFNVFELELKDTQVNKICNISRLTVHCRGSKVHGCGVFLFVVKVTNVSSVSQVTCYVPD